MEGGRRTQVILIVLFLCTFLPPIASKPFASQETPLVIKEVVVQTSAAYSWLSPIIHVVTIAILLALYRYGQRMGRLADAYFGVLFLFFAFGQHIAVTPSYGLTMIAGNLVMILIVGLFWLWEALKPQNEYVFPRLPAWRYWVIPFSVLAFWFPINADLTPNFSPLLLLTSPFGVTFCPTTPVIIALLTLIYPRVNKPLVRITSLAGLLIGLFNALSFFVMPGYTAWMLTLHTPLILVSAYGLLIPRLAKKSHSSHRTATQSHE